MITNTITWTLEKRTIKVFEGSKHVKSVPKIYEPIMDLANFDFSKKRLQAEEKEILNKLLFPFLKTSFEESLKKYEKYVYELIEGADLLGVREVSVFQKSKRLEIVYNQKGIERAVECGKDVFNICPEKLPLKHSNY